MLRKQKNLQAMKFRDHIFFFFSSKSLKSLDYINSYDKFDKIMLNGALTNMSRLCV